MSLATTYSRTSTGIAAPQVAVEVHLSNGLPSLSIVGLPETAVKESKDRVRCALINSNFEFPTRRITVNLAPADLPKKDGGRFDLAIALGILAASSQIPKNNLAAYEFAGELALDGQLRGFHGALPFALATKATKRILIVPNINADEAAVSEGITVLAANHILDVCAHLSGRKLLTPHKILDPQIANQYSVDLNDIRGQAHGKRALEIAAAGQHSLLMVGPPGTGKTMLASRLMTILPAMTEAEALETAAVYSISGKKFDFATWRLRPFRSPHHTASSIALVGGSSPPRPGEISLANNGVLFLDELPEFNRSVLEALREPLESGQITISRAANQAKFPANFQLIAAMNPCPCGHWANNKGNCHCTREQIHRYQNRISAPFLDRIDMHIEVPTLPKGILSQIKTEIESSKKVSERVISARKRQYERSGKPNANLTNHELEKFCQLNEKDRDTLEDSLEKLHISARAYHRILKISRTIADLAMSETIQNEHLQEALSYRKTTTTYNNY